MSDDFFADSAQSGDQTASERLAAQAKRATDAGSARMVRQKDELTGHAAGTAEELERLRMRADELEKQKREIEELVRKQEDYERGKKDILEKLDRSLVWVQKEKTQAERVVEIFSETQSRFRGMLDELRGINEEEWPDNAFEEQLNKAMVAIDMSNSDYRKALARIEATSWHKGGTESDTPEVLEELSEAGGGNKGFGYWFKNGLAATLPLMIFVCVAFLIYVAARATNLIR